MFPTLNWSFLDPKNQVECVKFRPKFEMKKSNLNMRAFKHNHSSLNGNDVLWTQEKRSD